MLNVMSFSFKPANAAFRDGLSEDQTGYTENKNYTMVTLNWKSIV